MKNMNRDEASTRAGSAMTLLFFALNPSPNCCLDFGEGFNISASRQGYFQFSVKLKTFNSGRGEIMNITELIIFLAIGAVEGWLSGTLMKGGGVGVCLAILLSV